MTEHKTVLIIDDDQDFQDIYSLYLQGASYHILRAGHGEEALEVLKKETPDAIILDVIMPVMDGEAFYEILRKEPKWKSIPVLVATVNEKLPEKIENVGGVTGHLRKPFEIESLLKMLEKALV